MKSKPVKRSPRSKAAKLQTPVRLAWKDDLLIAAIGASAGGIEAFTELMSHLPVDSGMAFVLVQHLDPKHHSLLTELLSKKTAMQVSGQSACEVRAILRGAADAVCDWKWTWWCSAG